MKSKVVILGLALLPTLALAGDWAKGYGDNITEAQQNALNSAKTAVKSQGKGCVTGELRVLPKENGYHVAEAAYAHHNGSCKKKESVIQNIERETGISIKL